MAATRLLVIADAKALPALANGLREGARFEVTTAALGDGAAAQAAIGSADALIVFYGVPGAPLPAALQTLSPKVRERGGRVVAVLQRGQAALRDDCFRAGASDLLFMPMARDQFVARLQASLELTFAAGKGHPAPVSVATRSWTKKVDQARVSAEGMETQSGLPVTAGETVRLQWGGFHVWGVVAREGPPLQVRFAGLAPEEEARIREWLEGGGALPAAEQPAPSPPIRSSPARSAPSAGPPPGFADRKPVRTPDRAAPRPAQPSAPDARTPPSAVAAQGAIVPPPPAPPLPDLFEQGDGSAKATAPAAAVSWPQPVAASACKAAALQVVAGERPGQGIPPALAAAARKVAGNLPFAERRSLETDGDESPFGDALAARVALAVAAGEGSRFAASTTTVDAEAVAALTRQAAAAITRLQKAADAAVGNGEVQQLQEINSASAALNRDLDAFKDLADRLSGVGSSPRPGAGALDPEVSIRGDHAPRARPEVLAPPAPAKAELRDFHDLDVAPGRAKRIVMFVLLAAVVAALANALYFSVPHHSEVNVEAAGRGVERIDVSGSAALVTVKPEWLEMGEAALPPLLAALKDSGAKKAVLILPNGVTAGVLDLGTGKVSGLLRPKSAAPPAQ